MHTVIKDPDGNKYTFDETNPLIVSTNPIYVSEENPTIYIKMIKQHSLLEYPEESAYIRAKIENELNTAKLLSDNFFPVPHVYHTKLTINSEYITGYIVMDKIDGKIISSVREFKRYFEKIFAVLNELLEFGIIYNDLNINNFIIGEEDKEIYLIDFEDVTYVRNIDNDVSPLVEKSPDGTISLNKPYIRQHLKENVKMRKMYRIGNSPRKTAKKLPPSKSSKRSTRSI